MSTKGRVSAVNYAQGPGEGPGCVVAVIGKRTYAIDGRDCHVAPAQIPLVEQPIFTADEAGLDHDLDIIMNRAAVDVILEGHAYAPDGPQPSFDVSVRVGDLSRHVRAFGDRRVELDAMGRVRFTPASPVEKVSLGWASAYGGCDLAASEAREIDDIEREMLAQLELPDDPRFGPYSYPRNPQGKGYLIAPTREALAACSLPNLEEASALLTPDSLPRGDPERWPLGPTVAAFGWLGYSTFPRSASAGIPPPLYDTGTIQPDDFIEVRFGLLKKESVAYGVAMESRLDIRGAQSSAVGMRVPELLPGASVGLKNLHRAHPSLSFSLPRGAPRMYLRLPGEEPIELSPKIRTLILSPDDDRLGLVWVGELFREVPLREGDFEKIQHAITW